jgi:F-type H+-transporting ATPase subunit delta
MIGVAEFRKLASITSAIGSNSRFSKILSDASLPVTAKIKLLNDVTGGQLGDSGELVDLLKSALGDVSSTQPLSQRLLSATAGAGFDAAEDLAKVEEGLRSFADVVRGNTELRFAMTDPGATDASKQAIVRDLLTGKADDISVALVNVLIAIHHGANLEGLVKGLADLAAKRQGHVVADVRTAIELDDSYQSRLAAALTRAVGTKVEPRFTVDPSIVGSVVVRVGDEVWGGSVRQRLEQARLDFSLWPYATLASSLHPGRGRWAPFRTRGCGRTWRSSLVFDFIQGDK